MAPGCYGYQSAGIHASIHERKSTPQVLKRTAWGLCPPPRCEDQAIQYLHVLNCQPLWYCCVLLSSHTTLFWEIKTQLFQKNIAPSLSHAHLLMERILSLAPRPGVMKVLVFLLQLSFIWTSKANAHQSHLVGAQVWALEFRGREFQS